MNELGQSITLCAPAKINLGLEVLGRRADGFHELVTLYQTIGLWDRVTLRRTGPPGVRLRVLPRSLDLGPTDSNLAVRAARLFPEIERSGLSIELRKSIPAGAGLGGGSSDAAAILLALGAWNHTPESELFAMAANLGSDVPFFLEGGTKLGVGRGERLLPLAPLPPLWVLLIYPGFPSETRQVYGGLNLTLTRRGPLSSLAERLTSCCSGLDGAVEQTLLGERSIPPDTQMVDRRETSDLAWVDESMLAELHNDLEPIATGLSPRLSGLLGEMKRLGASGARVTGSGSCLFALAPNRSVGRSWSAHFRNTFYQQGEGWARLVRTEKRGCSLAPALRDKNRRRSIGR